MNRALTFTVSLLCLLVSSYALACEYPKRADVPNGSTASKDEMIAGQKSVKGYMAAMEEYLDCIDEEEKSAVETAELSEEERASRDAAFTKKYNAAVEEMEIIAARFNEEVRAYKAQDQ